MKKRFLFIVAQLFLCVFIYAQKSKYYIYIPKKQDVPVAIHRLGANSSRVLLQSKNSQSLVHCLNRYNITNFEQAFPGAITDWLRDVYYIECDSVDRKTNSPLEKMITSQLKEQIPLAVKLNSPISTGGYVPNDPMYKDSINHREQMNLIHAPEAWEIVRRYPKIDVVINDIYFQKNEDLYYKGIIENIPQFEDNTVHGGFVAGCLGATTNNGKGITSLGGFNVNLIVSTKDWGEDREVLRLARLGYRVINCSWTNDSRPNKVSEAVYKEIRDIHNTVVVFGAGNGKETNSDPNEKLYPASYPTVLSVTSIGHKYNVGHVGRNNWKDVHDRVIGSIEKTHQHNEAVDICAPGYEVLSTMGPGYQESSGTSFAAPQVAATAALIMVVNPSLTARQVIDIIKSTADASIYNIPENRQYIGKLGTGRLDAYAAVKKACSVQLDSRMFSNETYSGCIVSIRNSRISANRTLVLNVTKEINFEGSFAIDAGGRLDVKYTGL